MPGLAATRVGEPDPEPPLALISNLCMIMGGLLGAAYFAKFFSVFALGPRWSRAAACSTTTRWSAGHLVQTDKAWILAGALVMVVLQTYILIRGTKSTFRWQNGAFLIAMAGMIVTFLVLAFATRAGSAQLQHAEQEFRRGHRTEGDLRRGRITPRRNSAT